MALNKPIGQVALRHSLPDDPTVNAALLPEVITRRSLASQADLPLATEGVLRYVWEGKFGPMLIEVRDDRAYVNGQAVEPAE